jgi:hypothetical protein
MKRPKNWRKGQTIFNFFEWLHTNKHLATNQNKRMADPFHITDEVWDKLYDEFLKENK